MANKSTELKVLRIQNFSPMMNVFDDARDILPLANGDPAECVVAENVQPIGTSIITSPGYELVCEISGAGGVKMLMNYEKTSALRYLLIAHDDDLYYITPASSVWTSIGTTGTVAPDNVSGVVYKGTSSTRRAIISSDTGTKTKSWDGTTLVDLSGTYSAPYGDSLAEFNGYLFIVSAAASSVSVAYCDVEDQTDWAGGGVIGFNGQITGLWAEDQALIVGTNHTFEQISFQYDDTAALSLPTKEPIKKEGGFLAHNSIMSIFSDVYYFGPNGFESFGFQPNLLSANRVVSSPSYKIGKVLQTINPTHAKKISGVFHDKKAMWAVPLDNDSSNNAFVVFDYDYNCWYLRTGLAPSGVQRFQETDGNYGLYFGSALSPKLYKFNTSYVYEEAGYNRIWKSKIFNFGSSMISKDFVYVTITGSMPINTTFYVKLFVDGEEQEFEVTSANLLSAETGSGYYADSFYADTPYGSMLVDNWYRYQKRIVLPDIIKEGKELQIQVHNTAPGEPWKMDTLEIGYEYKNPKNSSPNADA